MITLIGAGPCGSNAAKELCKLDNIEIFEEHKEIGQPIQCTGIVTSSIKEIIKIKKEYVNTYLKRVKLHHKNQQIELKLKNPNIVVDRHLFDKSIAEEAIDKGAKIYLDSKIIEVNKNQIKIKNKDGILIKKYDKIIGADGPSSIVAKSYNLQNNRRNYYGFQYRVKSEFDSEMFECIFNTPDFYMWIVPESNKIARIGVCSLKNPKPLLDNFIKKNYSKAKIIDSQGGLIPIYQPFSKINYKNKAYLIGDSAGQVKASTGGGLYHGLAAGRILKKSIEENKDYSRLCFKEFGKDLILHRLIRMSMNSFSEKDYTHLFNIIQDKKINKMLSNFDRDKVSEFFFKIILNKPEILTYMKNIRF